jgi:hypothetical protein
MVNRISGQLSYGQLYFWANVFIIKCYVGNRLSGQMSFWANVFLGKCLSGQISFWANVFWANIFLGKCFSGLTSSGEMYFWGNVLLGKRRMGNCLWVIVSGQMSYGQMSWNPFEISNIISRRFVKEKVRYWVVNIFLFSSHVLHRIFFFIIFDRSTIFLRIIYDDAYYVTCNFLQFPSLQIYCWAAQRQNKFSFHEVRH